MVEYQEVEEGRTSGATLWSPGTKKFMLYDWQTGSRRMAIAIGGSAQEIRQAPPTGPRFAAAEALAWKAHGSPLRCIAEVIVTPKGWSWIPYHGNLSWAKKNYREGGPV